LPVYYLSIIWSIVLFSDSISYSGTTFNKYERRRIRVAEYRNLANFYLAAQKNLVNNGKFLLGNILSSGYD